MKKLLVRTRRQVEAALRQIVMPFLHGSGYVDDTRSDKELQLVVLRQSQRFPAAFEESLREGVDGFVEYGIISDAYGGGLATVGYEQMPIEDLFRLHKFVKRLSERHFR